MRSLILRVLSAAVLLGSVSGLGAQGIEPSPDVDRTQRDVGLFDVLGLPGRLAKSSTIQEYGWLDMGYSYATSGPGQLAVAPQPDRFGREFLLNQTALVVTRPLKTDELSCGFYGQVFAGADAALLRGPGDPPSDNPRFAASFRQLYVSAHLPVFTSGGVDVVLGRQGTWMGYESYMAPTRPLYSLSYQWSYGEDGSDTGLWTTWHVSPQLDLGYALTLGSNTFFTLRGDAPCHLAQVNYWLQEDRKTQLTGTLLRGDRAVGNVIPFAAGTMDTIVELRARQTWNDRFSQVLQANLGWDQNIARVGVGQWYGVLTIGAFRLTPKVDSLLRLEWFDDVNGTRTGLATNYFAVTPGLNFRPRPWLSIRPELRGDFAGTPAFGPVDSLRRRSSQLTAAVECLFRF